MATQFHGHLPPAAAPPNPLVQDFLHKLDSIGADFLWIFAVYQEQLRTNKELKDQVIGISGSHELLRQTCNRAEQRIMSLESSLLKKADTESDCDTDFSSEGSIALEEAQERIKDQEDEIIYLRGKVRQTQAEHESKMVETARRYDEALTHASSLIIASAKKIEELELRSASEASNQVQDISKDCV